MKALWIAVLLLPGLIMAADESPVLENLIDQLEDLATEFAKEVEELFKYRRCNATDLEACSEANFNGCTSKFHCPACNFSTTELKIDICGNQPSVLDVTVSSVLVASKMSNQVIESICFSRGLDSYFRKARQKWLDESPPDEKRKIDPPTMFFGSHTGILRIFPGRPSDKCSPYSSNSVNYDPRRRPWYNAASSGPKNIILVVDTSLSMEVDNLNLLKEALNRTIDTLVYGDRLAIVAFNDTVHVFADQKSDGSYVMYEADSNHTDMALEEILQLNVGGTSNLTEAFTTAFQIVQNTIGGESLGTLCNTAILFFTGGNIRDVNETAVKQLISSSLADLAKIATKKIYFFTYSLSSETGFDSLPKALACAWEYGIWSKIDDDNIVESMDSYYQLFALGLDKGFTKSWVKPYFYSTGGVLGTTVSIPVYDNTSEPAIFIGVIGVDFPLPAVYKASDNKTAYEVIMNAVKAGPCPDVNLTKCRFESYRREYGNAICNASCSDNDFVDVKSQNCPLAQNFPSNLWANQLVKGENYSERVCCISGPTVSPYSSCPALMPPLDVAPSSIVTNTPISMNSTAPTSMTSKFKSGHLAITVVSALALVVALSALWKWKSRAKRLPSINDNPINSPSEPSSTTTANQISDTSRTPPSSNHHNPPLNPQTPEHIDHDILIDSRKQPLPLPQPPISNSKEENKTKTPPPLPLPSLPPLATPIVPSQ